MTAEVLGQEDFEVGLVLYLLELMHVVVNVLLDGLYGHLFLLPFFLLEVLLFVEVAILLLKLNFLL